MSNYILLRRQYYKPTDIPYLINPPLQQIWDLGEKVSFDFETYGADITAEGFSIRSLAVCDGKQCLVFDFLTLGTSQQETLLDWLYAKQLIAHNFVFDGGVLANALPNKLIPSLHADTYGLFRQLATEGFYLQSWSLKTLMVDILGWETANTNLLDAWLKQNKLGKADMSQAPGEILLPYNALDAIATWQAYEYFQTVLKSLGSVGNNLWDYHTTEWASLNRVLINLKLEGITFDNEHHAITVEEVAAETKKLREDFLALPEVAPHINDWVAARKRSYLDNLKSSTPKIMWKKDGTASKAQKNWNDKLTNPDFSKLNLNFNLKSSQQLQWLLYDKMFEAKKVSKKAFKLRGLDGVWREIPIPKTHKSEGFPTDKKARTAMGHVGKALSKYKKVAVELSKLLKMPDLVRADGCIHPDVNSAGTVTGRLSGASDGESNSNKFNIQNVTKTERTFRCFVAPEGETIVYSDFSSLEPRVAAFFSKDKTMYELYAKNKPHDVYLYVAAHIGLWAEEVRKFYDVDNPTKPMIKEAKAALGHIRTPAKIAHLSMAYNAGPAAVRSGINLAGNDITIQEATIIHRDYKKMFSGLGAFESKLKRMYEKNGGWIINGRGRPLPVALTFNNDILNRFVQSTGHDITMRYVYLLTKEIVRRKLPARPFIPDLHDATLWSIRDDLVPSLIEGYKEAYRLLNEELQWDIAITGDIKTGKSYDNFLEE